MQTPLYDALQLTAAEVKDAIRRAKNSEAISSDGLYGPPEAHWTTWDQSSR